jgi:hypothetical protein
MTRNNKSSDSNPEKQPVPWLWLGLGIIATMIGCVVGWMLVSSWLLQPPAEPVDPQEPVLIILTAPPSPTSAPTSPAIAPTPIPTFTPIPTPDTAVAPEAITPGFYASVANTDGLGLTVRGGPSTRNVVVTVAEEGTKVFILDGPQEAENFTWWQLRLDNGLEGWAVADFLEPAAEP